MGAATFLPLLIGMERFLRRKPIDFRPFVIISVSACGLAIGAMELLATTNDENFQIDPSRIYEGVITGIGFLGAGAMFREGSFVQGAGSAAAIWSSGAIGLICGFGELWLAIIITAIILILLLISGPYTTRWDPSGEKE
ncbi:MAG TPA: MgtC/SapB family protein [Parasphingorhabdus sp.]